MPQLKVVDSWIDLKVDHTAPLTVRDPEVLELLDELLALQVAADLSSFEFKVLVNGDRSYAMTCRDGREWSQEITPDAAAVDDPWMGFNFADKWKESEFAPGRAVRLKCVLLAAGQFAVTKVKADFPMPV